MSDLIKMYDYLMNEYDKYVEDFCSDDEIVAYANSCYIIAQAYKKKIKEMA